MGGSSNNSAEELICEIISPEVIWIVLARRASLNRLWLHLVLLHFTRYYMKNN